MDKSYRELAEIFAKWIEKQQPKLTSGSQGDTTVQINAAMRRIPGGKAIANSRTHTTRF